MNEPDLKQRWARILPAVFVTYSLAYLDRSNYGFGAAAGMAGELHISGQRSALLGALFFLGYMLPQIPGTAYASRHSARRLVFWALLAWGSFAALTGVIRNFWLLAADRLLLGTAESFVFPAMLVLLTRWFTKTERSRANAILMLGNPGTIVWMSAATGFLIHAAGWRTMFLLEGIVSVVWSFLWLVLVRDSPDEAEWMNDASRAELRRELEDGAARTAQRLRSARRLPLSECPAALHPVFLLESRRLRLRALAAAHHRQRGWAADLYHWAAHCRAVSLRRNPDASRRASLRPQPRAQALHLAVAGALRAQRSEPRASPRRTPSSGPTHSCLSRVAPCMLPTGRFFAIVPEMLPKNVAGQVMALVNSCGAFGGFAGTYLVGLFQAWTGSAQAGFLLMSLSLVVSGIIIAGMRPLPREVSA